MAAAAATPRSFKALIFTCKPQFLPLKYFFSKLKSRTGSSGFDNWLCKLDLRVLLLLFFVCFFKVLLKWDKKKRFVAVWMKREESSSRRTPRPGRAGPDLNGSLTDCRSTGLLGLGVAASEARVRVGSEWGA